MMSPLLAVIIAISIVGGLITAAIELTQFITGLPGFQKGAIIFTIIVYYLVRLAILAVKVLIPFFIIRFLIRKYDWSRKPYFILIAVAIAAIVTSGSNYRKYRRENPDVVAEWNKDLDEDAPALGRIIHYEAYRMIYDLETLGDKMSDPRRGKKKE